MLRILLIQIWDASWENDMGQKWGDELCDLNLVQRVERVRINQSAG